MLGLLNLRRLRQAYLLKKLASLAQTILDLLNSRRLRLTHSHTKPASLACSHYSKFEKITFFCENQNLR